MNVACLKLSPLLTPCICPFLIMLIASYLCNVRQAVSKEKKNMSGLTSRLMCPMVLFNEIVEVLHLSPFTAFEDVSCCLEFVEGFGIDGVFYEIPAQCRRG